MARSHLFAARPLGQGCRPMIFAGVISEIRPNLGRSLVREHPGRSDAPLVPVNRLPACRAVRAALRYGHALFWSTRCECGNPISTAGRFKATECRDAATATSAGVLRERVAPTKFSRLKSPWEGE